MDPIEILRLNLLSPMVLAFQLGVLATVMKSDLKIPEAISSIITLYLLFAIGLKGGFDLVTAPLDAFWGAAAVAVVMGLLIVSVTYGLMRRIAGFDQGNAVSIAIHYGGVSAVTLSAAVAFLQEIGQPFEGFMPAMYVIMELPAVILALVILGARNTEERQPLREVIVNALSGKSALLLGGGIVIGAVSGVEGKAVVAPFFVDLFPGILTLFFLEMGMLVAHRIGDIRRAGLPLAIFALLMPMASGAVAIALATLVGLSIGGAMVMGTLAASASFITAPAVVQANIPDANPGLPLTVAMAITLPFNLVLGLPLFLELARLLSTLTS